MGRARGSNAEMALVFESTYGTTPDSGFFRTPFTSADIGPSQGQIADETLGLGRDPQAPTLDVVEVGGSVDVPMDLNNTGRWLKALLGAPTTSGAGPYTHVYTSGATAALPSLSVEMGFPEVPYFEMIEGIKVGSWAVNMARGQGQNLTGRFEMTGKGYTGDTTTNAGTPTEMAIERFSHFQGGVSRDDTALADVISCNFTYSNGLDPLNVIAPDGEIGGIDEGVASLTGQMVVRFSSTALITQAAAGTAMDLDLSWTIASGKSLAVAIPRVFIDRPRIGISGPGGVDVTYSFTAAQLANGDPMMTATLINSTESY